MEHLYEIKHTKYFDPRTMFIIQTESKLYLWIGDSIYLANKEMYIYINSFLLILGILLDI